MVSSSIIGYYLILYFAFTLFSLCSFNIDSPFLDFTGNGCAFRKLSMLNLLMFWVAFALTLSLPRALSDYGVYLSKYPIF